MAWHEKEICCSKSIQYNISTISKGTQYNVSTISKGIQCSPEKNASVHHKSTCCQYDPVHCVSKSTQCSFQDILDSTSLEVDACIKSYVYPNFSLSFSTEDEVSSNSIKQFTCETSSSGSVSEKNSSSVCGRYCKNMLDVRPTSKNIKLSDVCKTLHKCSESESQSIKKSLANCQMKHVQHSVHINKKNFQGETSQVIKSIPQKNRRRCASSSTSGIGEMSDFRSSIAESEDCPAPNKKPKKIVKQQKKLLWTQSRDASSFSDDDCLDFSNLCLKMKSDYTKKLNQNRKKPSKVQYRRNYTYKEEFDIIKYIIERNVYNNVGGVRLWQDMEEELKINRTWQSMKEHFRKKILPNVQKFELSPNVKKLFCKINMR